MINRPEDKRLPEVEFIRYVIMGNPIPLARARSFRSRVYDSQKQAKLLQGLSLQQQHGDREMYTGALHLEIEFYLYIPKAYQKKNIINKPHACKPDLDNLIKFTVDVATGILYHDDSLIASISSKKLYDDVPRTEFYLREIR